MNETNNNNVNNNEEKNNNHSESQHERIAELVKMVELYERVTLRKEHTIDEFLEWIKLWKTIQYLNELGMLKHVESIRKQLEIIRQVDELEEPPRKRKRRIIRPKHRMNRQKN